MRRARRGVAVATVALQAALLPLSPASADPTAPVPADHIVAVRIPGGSGVNFAISCSAENWQDGEYFEDVLAGRGAWFATTRMSSYFVQITDVHSSKGRAVQVEGMRIVAETKEDPRGRGISGFAFGVSFIGDAAIDPPEFVFLAVATWGAKPDCRGQYNGGNHDLFEQPRAHAFYAGPYAFDGVLAQDRRDQVVAAGRLTASLPGGPAFGHLQIGHYGSGAIAFVGDEPDLDTTVCRGLATDGCDLSAGSLASDAIVVTTPASLSLGGADHGLFAIGLHPEDPR